LKNLPLRFNLMLNGFVGANKREELNTEAGLAKFLRYVAKCAEMKLITQMTVNIEDATDGEWYGLSGLAMIATSHIAMHVWPSYDTYYMFDISSCKPFSEIDLIKDIEDYLESNVEFKLFKAYAPHIESFDNPIKKYP